jgi:tRNA pseudouridine38-40 synthase
VTRFGITLAYDGTDFEGWQAQARGRTVQGAVEEALATLAEGRRVAVFGASRTDAGAHALGQVATFELERGLPPEALQKALNGLLPPEVRVLGAASVPPSFHARRSAQGKSYRYELDTAVVQLPMRRRYAGHWPERLDAAAVEAVAALFVGRHDFAALASAGGGVKTTVRSVRQAAVRFEGETLVFEVEGDGFLRKMVRSMVGGLIAAGRGASSVSDLRAAFAGRERRAWPAPAEARGLCLVRVDYPADAGFRIEQGGAASHPPDPPAAPPE